MTGQQLKNSILQMAVQGKLVPQDPNDEPASVLLERIRKEKEQLIKEGKIKKEKNPSYIFRGADNLPYENANVPYNIPNNWVWLKHNDIFEISGGSQPPKSKFKSEYQDGYIRLYQIRDYGNDPVPVYIPISTASKIADKGDILLARYGASLGKVFWAEYGAYNVAMARVIPKYACLEDIIDRNYLYYYYHSDLYRSIIFGNSRSAQAGFNKDDLDNLWFPLPPISEQQRIVNKIRQLESHLIEYNIAEANLKKLNNDFPDLLKKSILQEAVQGKLVPQDENDEPASVLLERIRAEKQNLVAEGKIKKDKHESVIFRRDNSHYEKRGSEEVCIDNEIPFDIPNSWEWCRIGSLFQINPHNNINDDTDAGFIPMALIKDGFKNEHCFETRKWKDIKSGFTHFANGDIVVAKITPCFQNRKSAIISNLPNGVGAGTTELHVIRDVTSSLYMPYVLLFLKTNDFIENGVKNFSGTAGQQRIGKDFVSNYLIPIPPVNEQKRIVDSALKIFSKIENLAD